MTRPAGADRRRSRARRSRSRAARPRCLGARQVECGQAVELLVERHRAVRAARTEVRARRAGWAWHHTGARSARARSRRAVRTGCRRTAGSMRRPRSARRRRWRSGAQSRRRRSCSRGRRRCPRARCVAAGRQVHRRGQADPGRLATAGAVELTGGSRSPGHGARRVGCVAVGRGGTRRASRWSRRC